MDARVIETKRRGAVLGQQQGAVQIGPACALGNQSRGRHGEARPHHAADHDAVAFGTGSIAQGQCFGQAAGLVQLDIHHIVFALELWQARAVMAAFVGADGQGAVDFGQHVVRTRRKTPSRTR